MRACLRACYRVALFAPTPPTQASSCPHSTAGFPLRSLPQHNLLIVSWTLYNSIVTISHGPWCAAVWRARKCITLSKGVLAPISCRH